MMEPACTENHVTVRSEGQQGRDTDRVRFTLRNNLTVT